jgi:hypothetical protein
MTIILTCPACTKAHHAPSFATDPHYCSIACYHIGQTLDRPKIPSCPDTVTSHPPAARRSAPTPAEPPPTVDTETPPHQRSSPREPSPRRPITVYECNTCGRRAVGEQRCTDCTTFMRSVGIGGSCPCCDEPIAIAELLAEEVITRR